MGGYKGSMAGFGSSSGMRIRNEHVAFRNDHAMAGKVSILGMHALFPGNIFAMFATSICQYFSLFF